MKALKAVLAPFSERIFAVTRIVMAFLYACHGAQKLFGVLGGQVMTDNPLFLTAGIIETFGGLLLILGWQTTPVAFLCSGEMAVAYFKFHFPNAFFPIMNHGELPAAFSFFFLFLASRGAGPWSVDAASR